MIKGFCSRTSKYAGAHRLLRKSQLTNRKRKTNQTAAASRLNIAIVATFRFTRSVNGEDIFITCLVSAQAAWVSGAEAPCSAHESPSGWTPRRIHSSSIVLFVKIRVIRGKNSHLLLRGRLPNCYIVSKNSSRRPACTRVYRDSFSPKFSLPKAERASIMQVYGAWLSPARARGSGPRGPRFKSGRPDYRKISGKHYLITTSRMMRNSRGSSFLRHKQTKYVYPIFAFQHSKGDDML